MIMTCSGLLPLCSKRCSYREWYPFVGGVEVLACLSYNDCPNMSTYIRPCSQYCLSLQAFVGSIVYMET